MYPTGGGANPYLYYEDLAAAIPWLCETFGFEERFRVEMPGGAVAHAELQMGDAIVMLGNVGTRNAARPGSVRSSVYLFVDDVDKHCEHADSQGVEIVQQPADQPYGDRIYLALDVEGHEWYFAQRVRQVAIEDVR